VVLDELVREAILLELPSFPLCSETCEGDGRAAEPALEGTREDAGTQATSPFAALRHLLTGESLPPEETAGNARSPSPADIRRINRAKKRGKPRIRSSAHQRGKK